MVLAHAWPSTIPLASRILLLAYASRMRERLPRGEWPMAPLAELLALRGHSVSTHFVYVRATVSSCSRTCTSHVPAKMGPVFGSRQLLQRATRKKKKVGGKTKNGYKDSCYILQGETDELIFQQEATWKPRIIYFLESQFVSCELKIKNTSLFISILFLCLALAISLLEP